MGTFLYSNRVSLGAKLLSQEMNIRRIKLENSKYSPKASHVIINWGNTSVPLHWNLVRILNKPDAIATASNKLSFFRTVQNHSRVVPWTTEVDDVVNWLNDGEIVVVRSILTGHSGNGIIILEGDQETPNAPLYTKYIPKKEEYRLHIVGSEVIDIQRKIKDPEKEVQNWKVRSHDNGFMYVRNNVIVSDDARSQALAALNACQLDFGAVDIVINSRTKEAFVLEINTAPGLEGQTVTHYASALQKLLNV